MVGKKKNQLIMGREDRKNPSLDKPSDANGWSSGQIFSIPPSQPW